MKITAKCPLCSGKLTLSSYETATEVCDRKCRACGVTWRAVVRPLTAKREGIKAMHEVTFSEIRRPQGC